MKLITATCQGTLQKSSCVCRRVQSHSRFIRSVRLYSEINNENH